jgi:hypothetical protein
LFELMGLRWDIAPMNSSANISIRSAHVDDCIALWQLATLDSSEVPSGPLLVAEQDGDVVAAISLSDGEAIADPFRRTRPAVDLLRLRSRQLLHQSRPRRLRRRTAVVHPAQ